MVIAEIGHKPRLHDSKSRALFILICFNSSKEKGMLCQKKKKAQKNCVHILMAAKSF